MRLICFHARYLSSKIQKSYRVLRDKWGSTNVVYVCMIFLTVTYFRTTPGIHPRDEVAKSISRGLRIARTEDGIFASSARMPATAVITSHFHGTLPQRWRNGVEGTKGERAEGDDRNREINRRQPWRPVARDFAKFPMRVECDFFLAGHRIYIKLVKSYIGFFYRNISLK